MSRYAARELPKSPVGGLCLTLSLCEAGLDSGCCCRDRHCIGRRRSGQPDYPSQCSSSRGAMNVRAKGSSNARFPRGDPSTA
jgi:hypothetical protein